MKNTSSCILNEVQKLKNTMAYILYRRLLSYFLVTKTVIQALLHCYLSVIGIFICSLILRYIKCLTLKISFSVQPLVMSLQSLLSGLEVYIFAVITMPIRLELIQRLRTTYISNIDQTADNVGKIIGKLKRIAIIIPMIQLNLVSVYVHIFPMIRHLHQTLILSSNRCVTIVFLLLSTCCNIALCIRWIILKCTAFSSDDNTIERMRYFAQNSSRILHDQYDLNCVTMQMFTDQILYNRATTLGYALRSLMQIQYLLTSLLLYKLYDPTSIIHILLLGVHQYRFTYAVSNVLIAFYGMPDLTPDHNLAINDYNKEIRLSNISFHDIFSDISVTLQQKQYCLYGNNGIGKTVFAKLLTKQITPDFGIIETLHKSIYLNDNNEVDINSISKCSKLQHILNKQHSSKGESNLLAIYSVSLIKPNLIILDETLDNIDTYNLNIAFDILNNMDCIKIIITHNRDIIEKCKHFIRIIDKKVIIS